MIRSRGVPEGASVLDLGPARSVLRRGRGQVLAGSVPVLIVRMRRRLVAVPNRCPHRGMPLTDATTHGKYLRCPFHGREYDVVSGTGECRGGGEPLRTFPCWLERGRIFLALPGKSDPADR